MNYLHHHLLRLDGSEDVLAKSFLLDGVCELLGDLIVDVGIEKCATHILQSLGYVNLCYFAFALQYLEGPFEAF